jgi:hypothetical protein
MTLDLALAHLGSITARLEHLNESLLTHRRSAIRFGIYLAITDPFDREDAIQAAHDSGLMTSPFETFQQELLTVIHPWLPAQEVNDGK